MLVVESKDLEKLHRALKDLDGPRGIAWAAKESLNTSAFAARREWARQGRKQMIVRQPKTVSKAASGWTFGARNHRVVKARLRKSINQMESVSGNKLRYVAQQEHGVHKTRAKGLQIPETEARISGDKRRLVSRAYWRSAIAAGMGPRFDAKHGKFGGNRRRYAAATIRAAKARGSRFIYLKYSRRQRGIYDLNRLTRGKDLKQALVWDMSRRHTYTRPHPMLRTAIRKLTPVFPTYHRASLEQQLRFVLKKRGFRARGPSILAEVAKFRALQK